LITKVRPSDEAFGGNLLLNKRIGFYQYVRFVQKKTNFIKKVVFNLDESKNKP
jgi:hypothetical protein